MICAVPSPLDLPVTATAPSSASALVLKAKSGDRAAFGALFARFRPMVHGIALARTRGQDVDDIVQEVFAVALERLGSLTTDAAVGAWIATITRNLIVDRRRRARPTEDGIEEIADRRAASDEIVEARRILEVIQSLPQAYRETLVLRLVEGMSGPEIAAMVGITPESVRVNLHRGMKRLKEALSS